MFDWWKRRKEWPLLDGEELLYTDRSGRFAVTTHRLRVHSVLFPMGSLAEAEAAELSLDDISDVSVTPDRLGVNVFLLPPLFIILFGTMRGLESDHLFFGIYICLWTSAFAVTSLIFRKRAANPSSVLDGPVRRWVHGSQETNDVVAFGRELAEAACSQWCA